MAVLRICFVGDSITLGVGDDAYNGWPGRLCRAETARGHDVTLYNLGIRADTSELVRQRWQIECTPRLPDTAEGALVFAFGVNDMAELGDTGIRVPLARSCVNARAILGAARDWRPTLMVGPIPTVDAMQPYTYPNGMTFNFVSARAAALSAAYAELCAGLGVPFLNLHERLADDVQWQSCQRAIDGVHVSGDGYALIADLVGAWPAWRAWFD